MKRYSIAFCRLEIISLVLILFLLIYNNYKVIKNINLKTAAVNNVLLDTKDNIKKYGYSDIFNLLIKDSNIGIINITSSLEYKELVNVDIEYNGDILSFYNTLDFLSKSDNFCYVDNIKIETDADNKKKIYSTISFINNK